MIYLVRGFARRANPRITKYLTGGYVMPDDNRIGMSQQVDPPQSPEMTGSEDMLPESRETDNIGQEAAIEEPTDGLPEHLDYNAPYGPTADDDN